jgi:hypothetical protein
MIYCWILHTSSGLDYRAVSPYLELVHRLKQAGFVVENGGEVRTFDNTDVTELKMFVRHMSKYSLDLFILSETGICPFSVECNWIEQ